MKNFDSLESALKELRIMQDLIYRLEGENANLRNRLACQPSYYSPPTYSPIVPIESRTKQNW